MVPARVTALRGSAMSRFNSGADIANPALLTQCRLGHCVFKGEANFDLICRSGESMGNSDRGELSLAGSNSTLRQPWPSVSFLTATSQFRSPAAADSTGSLAF